MKNIRDFLSENIQFLEVKFSIYLNRRVFETDIEYRFKPELGKGVGEGGRAYIANYITA